MKPAAFDYRIPSNAADAGRALEQGAGAAKLVAGSQSLGPLLNLRLVIPTIALASLAITGTAGRRG